MPRYVAFLRGVSPMNLKMPELKLCLEKAGFTEVKTFLSSGNVAFNSRALTEGALEKKIEKAMEQHLDRVFYTIVRSVDSLQEILNNDPYQEFKMKPGSKRVVTFLREKPAAKTKLPIELDNAQILKCIDKEIYSVYVPHPTKGPVFMNLIERTFGKNVTTRTLETVKKVVR